MLDAYWKNSADRLRFASSNGEENEEALRPAVSSEDEDLGEEDLVETDLVQVGAGEAGGSALQCKTLSTRGPKCWGHAVVYCPKDFVMVGGGMASDYGSFERSHPYKNGWMCDNRHGCGSGTCYVRCCNVPGFDAEAE